MCIGESGKNCGSRDVDHLRTSMRGAKLVSRTDGDDPLAFDVDGPVFTGRLLRSGGDFADE